MTKIDIFSGFLGAGKTTLIKKLIKEAYSGEKLVLVENEFGEIGVDGTFMQDAGITVNELNSGCICCSLVGDFAKALHQVIETYHPDRVLIEPSGVGKLSDVITAVQKAGVVGAELNTFTTVVDATKAKMYMKNFGEFFNNQVENASCIIFSHTDVANEKKLEEALALVKEHNPGATVILTPWDQLSGADILSAMEHKDTLEMELQRLKEEHEKAMAEEEGHHHHHHHDGECGCGHHHHHHDHDADEVFTSWGLETNRTITKEKLESLLQELAHSEKYGQVLRAKGMLPDADGTWYYFDLVPEETEVRTGAPIYTGKVCVIGSNLKEDELKAAFEA